MINICRQQKISSIPFLEHIPVSNRYIEEISNRGLKKKCSSKKQNIQFHGSFSPGFSLVLLMRRSVLLFTTMSHV